MLVQARIQAWLGQCRNEDHAVFGTGVDPSRVRLIRRKEGGVMMRFQLPDDNPPLTSPALFSTANYPHVCATSNYGGSRENFVAAVRLALRNCHEDED